MGFSAPDQRYSSTVGIQYTLVHHLSAVAAGVKHADALTLENAAATLTFLDTRSANRAVVRAP